MTAVIGLFSGAGGLEIGAGWAGADLRLAVEIDPQAAQTLRENRSYHPCPVQQQDVATLTGRDLRRLAGLGRTEPCILIGGPPCQPFSKAAYWTDPGDDSRYRQARARGEKTARPTPITEARPDARRSLVDEFWRLVSETSAVGFLFENVPSIAHPRSRPLLQRFLDQAASAGYDLLCLTVNATDYGVPQSRRRVVVLGLKGGKLTVPAPTHGESGTGNLLPVVTAGEALAPFAPDRFSEPEEEVRGRWASHLREVPPGQNYKALTAWAGHPSPSFVAETRFWHFLLKLSPDRPSWTIPATPGPWVGPFHWESRRLRTVELAALQGFPAGYHFVGKRRDRVRQIGNAVPPPLAQRMIAPLLEASGSDGGVNSRTRLICDA